MIGSFAKNPHTGSRSEILADYLLSGWGTVTPVRRQDDHGIDLHCTLTASMGKRSVVTDYYSVQVKSDTKPWLFSFPESIDWLINYPIPLFLGCVDKKKTMLSIYQTVPRFQVPFWPPGSRLSLIPSNDDEGKVAQWEHPQRYSLGPPILRVTLEDLMNPKKLLALRDVLDYWVKLDNYNCALQRIGILRFRTPISYRVNVVPPSGGHVERGKTHLTRDQMSRAISSLVEVIDCVGHQLSVEGDQTSALYAAMWVRHLRVTRKAELSADSMWGFVGTSPFEQAFSTRLNAAITSRKDSSYLFEALDAAANVLHAYTPVSNILGTNTTVVAAPTRKRKQSKVSRKRARRGKLLVLNNTHARS